MSASAACESRGRSRTEASGRFRAGLRSACYSRTRRRAALKRDPAGLEPLTADELARDTRRGRIRLLLSGGRETFLEALLRRPAFHADALCREHTEVSWFDDEPDPRALAICARCAVADECRAWATKRRDVVGVWGGFVLRERPGSIAA